MKKNMSLRKLLAFILRWRRRNLSDNQFMLAISFMVGILTALAGLCLKWFIEQIAHFLTQGFVITGGNWPYLVYPILGIFLTMLFIQ